MSALSAYPITHKWPRNPFIGESQRQRAADTHAKQFQQHAVTA